VLIRYTIVETPLGRTLVATTPKGICFICFGDDDKQLQGFLSAEYPAAIFHRDDEALSAQVELITRHLEGHHPDICLPLDVQATAFRLRVWEALRKIPYGSTRTYAEVAQAIGQPKAVRAVASACANNPVPLVTPCHRVVRSDGKAGEYRWGEARKRDLLSREVTTEINEKAITDRQ
jgi:AraC family transcriptional regulator of adaptative response/methylated-DNA-[protein]-cysteine methyltransferase